jgi:2-haloacid dehalogenase
MGTGFESLVHKPRLQAFEYMIDQLGCDPADLLNVSSRLRYDHMSAYDVGIRHTVYMERGHGPSTDYYGYPTLQDLGGLPAIVGLD